MEEIISKSRKSKMKRTPDDIEAMKLEIAEELGLLDKVRAVGWASLTAKETGKMGGILTQRKKQLKKSAEENK
ncbi:MAG: small, acid-soluble spore protein, alpha/beta type [Clostridiales bacterium]